jgi:MFS family permease
MAMSLVAGVLVDRVGLKGSVFLFLSFCLFGSALFGLSISMTTLQPDTRYFLMFAGRFIFGLGGGSITIAQNAITAYWFRNRELAMAFGCTLTMSRLGSVLNFTLTKTLFNTFFGAFYAGDAAMVVHCENSTGTGNGTHHHHGNASSSSFSSPMLWDGQQNHTGQDPVIMVACQSALGATFWCGSGLVALSFGAAVYWLCMHTAEDKRKIARAAESLLEDADDKDSTTKSKSTRKKMKLSDVFEMPVSFWLVVLTICAFYCIVFPFMAIAPDYLTHAKLSSACKHLDTPAAQHKCYSKAQTEAGPYTSLVYLMSAIISPFLGRAVDYFGRRGSLAVLSTSLTIPVFLLLAHTDVNPALPMVLLGLSYCGCAAVLWPTIQYLVPEKVVGSANGIATSVQMLGIGLCNIAVGKLMDASKGTDKPYASLMLFFTVLGCVSVSLALLLKCVDAVRGNKLHAGQRDRERAGAEEGGEMDHDSMVNSPMVNSPNTALQGLLSPSAATAGMGSRR